MDDNELIVIGGIAFALLGAILAPRYRLGKYALVAGILLVAVLTLLRLIREINYSQ